LIIIGDRKPVVSSLGSLKGTLHASYLSYSQFVEDEGVAGPTDLDPEETRFQSVEFSYQILALPDLNSLGGARGFKPRHYTPFGQTADTRKASLDSANKLQAGSLCYFTPSPSGGGFGAMVLP
jgi:hypothetical protein